MNEKSPLLDSFFQTDRGYEFWFFIGLVTMVALCFQLFTSRNSFTSGLQGTETNQIIVNKTVFPNK